ncbi:MAG: signal peptidase II [Alphaproteobacteria bacterium CG_4_9_14_3_um_filter_47_13]|nr:MAG: signal peptidase II [Alphaproteobacteria bacterium CG_4_9_14_3_um_filter_47_13]
MNKFALFTGLIIFILDQITKMLVLELVAEKNIAVLPFFNLVLVWNRGISFGLFNDGGASGALILSVISLLIVGGLVIWLMKIQDKYLTLAACAIIAGAMGNIIDRIRYGAVVDFLDFHAFGWHYPAFNIADSAIVLGIAFILFDSIFLEAKRKGTIPHV